MKLSTVSASFLLAASRTNALAGNTNAGDSVSPSSAAGAIIALPLEILVSVINIVVIHTFVINGVHVVVSVPWNFYLYQDSRSTNQCLIMDDAQLVCTSTHFRHSLSIRTVNDAFSNPLNQKRLPKYLPMKT